MQSEEKRDSLAIFFILIVIVAATFLVHCLIVTEVHYMPESLAIVLLGICSIKKLFHLSQELLSD